MEINRRYDVLFPTRNSQPNRHRIVVRLEAIAMKKLRLGLVLVALIVSATVSACDNKLPPTKAPDAGQSPYVAGNSVTKAGSAGN
ncbi:hypothetical protein FKO01_20880 [Mesorhizobium sp. B2-3-3]|nr:hypothetical protein FKO01_20880 [Mesorhizobium sp. B2-3-3]